MPWLQRSLKSWLCPRFGSLQFAGDVVDFPHSPKARLLPAQARFRNEQWGSNLCNFGFLDQNIILKFRQFHTQHCKDKLHFPVVFFLQDETTEHFLPRVNFLKHFLTGKSISVKLVHVGVFCNCCKNWHFFPDFDCFLIYFSWLWTDARAISAAVSSWVFPDAQRVSVPPVSHHHLPFLKHPTICLWRKTSDDEPYLNITLKLLGLFCSLCQ